MESKVVFEWKHVQFFKWCVVFAIMLVANIIAFIPKGDPINFLLIYSLFCLGVQLWERDGPSAAMCDVVIFAGAVLYLIVIAFTGIEPNLGVLVSSAILGIPGMFAVRKAFH